MVADQTWFQYREKEEEITIIGEKEGNSIEGRIYDEYIPTDRDIEVHGAKKIYKAFINSTDDNEGFISFTSDYILGKILEEPDFSLKKEAEKAYLEFGKIIGAEETFKDYLIEKAKKKKPEKKLDTTIPRHLDSIKRDKDLEEVVKRSMEVEEDKSETDHERLSGKYGRKIPRGFKGVERLNQ